MISAADEPRIEYDDERHAVRVVLPKVAPAAIDTYCVTADEVLHALRRSVVSDDRTAGSLSAYALALNARGSTEEGPLFLVANGIAGRMLRQAQPENRYIELAVSRMSKTAAEVCGLPFAERADRMLSEAHAIRLDLQT